MARSNRTCFICGKSYRYCPTCAEDRNKPGWYNMFCSEVCNELNHILTENNFGRINDEDAGEMLGKLQLPEFEHVDTKQKIDELMAVKKKTKRPKSGLISE